MQIEKHIPLIFCEFTNDRFSIMFLKKKKKKKKKKQLRRVRATMVINTARVLKYKYEGSE